VRAAWCGSTAPDFECGDTFRIRRELRSVPVGNERRQRTAVACSRPRRPSPRGAGEHMRISRASMILIIAALLSTAAHTAGAQPANASQRAFAPARRALDAAIAAHGGLEALQAIKDISRTGNGTAYNQGQSLKPGTPYSTRAVIVKSVVDFPRGRS